MGWFNFDFSQSVMDAVQDLRSPANRIGFPPTRGCRTTPASCPQNLRSGSSRKTGSRQIGKSPTSSAQNEIPYGGIGTYVRLGPCTALISASPAIRREHADHFIGFPAYSPDRTASSGTRLPDPPPPVRLLLPPDNESLPQQSPQRLASTLRPVRKQSLGIQPTCRFDRANRCPAILL